MIFIFDMPIKEIYNVFYRLKTDLDWIIILSRSWNIKENIIKFRHIL